MTKKIRRTFTEEFKQQIVQLYQNGKPRKDLIREYDLPLLHLISGLIKVRPLVPLKKRITLAPTRKSCRNLENVISN